MINPKRKNNQMINPLYGQMTSRNKPGSRNIEATWCFAYIGHFNSHGPFPEREITQKTAGIKVV